jgi:hypothetical protein
MADIVLDTQVAPSTPSAGSMNLYPETTTLQFVTKDTNGRMQTLGDITNQSVTAQAYTTAEIYVTGSALTVPAHLLQLGARCRWRVVASKTNGTGSLVWKLYKGTLGTTGDTAIATLTQASAPTGVSDTAVFDIEAVLRNTGASGVMLFSVSMIHALAATGLQPGRGQRPVRRGDGVRHDGFEPDHRHQLHPRHRGRREHRAGHLQARQHLMSNG